MANPLATDLEYVLGHTSELWEELRSQRLFITGGTGFFGCWLLESFAWANERLRLNATAVVLTRNLAAFSKKAPHLAAHPAIQLHQGDVRSFEFPKGTFSHVIHAATEASAKLNQEAPELMLDTILQGTKQTLEFAKCCGAKKFLLVSSGAIYGKQPAQMTHIPEEYPGAPDIMQPQSAYGEGKRLAELLCAVYAKMYGIEAKIARGFAFVGPYLPIDTHFAIGNFIRDGLKGSTIQIGGDGTPYRSYLYAADLALWLWTILFQGESCRPYNVGSDEDITIANLAKLVASCFQPEPEVRIAKQAAVGKSAERYVPSIERAVSELKLKPTVDLHESVRRTVAWHAHTGGDSGF